MIIQIKETSLYVRDLSITKKFYNEMLGLEVIGFVVNRHIFFKAGTSILLCFIADTTKSDTKLPPHSASGSIHIAFEVSKEEYDQWKDKIENAAIEIVQEYDWGGGFKSFYFHDPDNHLLEIVPKGLWERN